MQVLDRAFVAVCAAALSSGVAAADVVIDWNNVTLDTIREERLNPLDASRALAMVHIAVFDAVNNIQRGHASYADDHPAPPNASVEAAAAEAVYTVLSSLFPDREPVFAEARAATFATVATRHALRKGIETGHEAGLAILALRADDHSDDVVPYTPSGTFGAWQPTPPAFAPALRPGWGLVTPFAMTSGSQFRLPPPPAFTSAEYAAAYNEVKNLGGAASVLRTPDQTVIAYFWEDGAGSVTPPGHWQVLAQQVGAEFGNTTIQNARLFALLSIVQADAAILAWDTKFTYNFIRPYTAITTQAALDGNPDTTADPSWTSLIPTPPFPSYTSGHSTFSGGSARLLALFFGTDDVAFSAPSPDPDRWPLLDGVTRSWSSFSQAAEEAGQSRIYGGIHWQFDNQGGLVSGRELADDVYRRLLRPLGRGRQAPSTGG
jgi:membrane-associated phospholipid phosphatase